MRVAGCRALVTGGSGLVGSHVVDELLKAGCRDIVVVDNFVSGRRENLAEAQATGCIRLIEGDVRTWRFSNVPGKHELLRVPRSQRSGLVVHALPAGFGYED
jgi:UDP-glucose 4-epimerase